MPWHCHGDFCDEAAMELEQLVGLFLKVFARLD